MINYDFEPTLLDARQALADADLCEWHLRQAQKYASKATLEKFEGLTDRIKTAVNTARYVVRQTEEGI